MNREGFAVVPKPPPLPKKRHSFRPLMLTPQPSERPAPARPGASPQPPLPRVAPPPPKPAAPARSANDSYVRIRPPSPSSPPSAEIDYLDAAELQDELCEDQLTMSMNLACLERAVEDAPRDASARAALRTLEARIKDLGALRDALAAVQLASVDPRFQRLYLPDAPLAEYVRGVYAWVHAAMRALEQLATSMRTLQHDWALVRWRIEEAKNFHFDELHEPIRRDLIALTIVASAGSFGSDPPAIDELHYAAERLFATAIALEEHLDERFG